MRIFRARVPTELKAQVGWVCDSSPVPGERCVRAGEKLHLLPGGTRFKPCGVKAAQTKGTLSPRHGKAPDSGPGVKVIVLIPSELHLREGNNTLPRGIN